VWGAAPLQTVAAPTGAHRFLSAAWGRPEGGAFTARRAQPIRRVEELDASPSARVSGAAQRRLAAKEETRQAAKSLLASVNAPGSTQSDLRTRVWTMSVAGVPTSRPALAALWIMCVEQLGAHPPGNAHRGDQHEVHLKSACYLASVTQ